MRNFPLSEYFYYTRLERNATLALSVLCVISYAAPFFYPLIWKPAVPCDFEEVSRLAKSISLSAPVTADRRPKYEQSDRRGESYTASEPETFAFDPNTATKEVLMRLGLSARAAQTLVHYREKGGRFRQPEDLKKLYGLRPEDYQRLLPWVRIPEAAAPEVRLAEKKDTAAAPAFSNGDRYKWKEKTLVEIDINQATAEDWQQFKGIGPGFSKRIVLYRDKLGGFASAEQVGEVYNLPDSTFQLMLPYLKPSPVFRQLKVNSATLDELKAHPYLSNLQATVLFNYRAQHGPLTAMADIGKMKVFQDVDLRRLNAYFSFE